MTALSLPIAPASVARSAKRHDEALRWLVLLGVASSLLYIASPWFSPQSGFSEEERIAIHLASGHGFLSPFSAAMDAPPTSWCPPVFCALVAAVYRLFGVESDASVAVILAFSHLCRVMSGVGLYVLGRQRFTWRVGVIACVVFLVHPIFLQMPSYCWDNCLAMAMFIWLVMLAGLAFKGKLPLLGIGLGALLLTNAAYVLTLPIFVWFASRNLKQAAVVTLVCTVTLLPWTIRNAVTFHRLMLVRGNMHTELWLGNQPTSTGWLTLSNLEAHPSGDPANRSLVLSQGEVAYDRVCADRFWSEVRADRWGFVRRTAMRCAYLFVGEPGARFRCLLSSMGCVLGLSGAWLCWRLRQRAGLQLFLIGMAAVAPYVATQVYDRYAMPLRAMLILLGAVAIEFAWERLQRARLKVGLTVPRVFAELGNYPLVIREYVIETVVVEKCVDVISIRQQVGVPAVKHHQLN